MSHDSRQHDSHSHGAPVTGVPHTAEELSESLHAHDEWFRHAPGEHHQEAHGGTNAVVILGFLGATVLFVGVVGFAVYKVYEVALRAEQVAMQERRTPRAEYAGLRADWQAQLSSFAWTDKEKGRVRVPLEVAKRLVMEEYRSPGAPAR
ncbi:MAG TPA: hypothetical protein DEB06_05090 [Phycisphaerales bacterium]|nr:hypothetical protein [Phycisphaerales bacterium]